MRLFATQPDVGYAVQRLKGLLSDPSVQREPEYRFIIDGQAEVLSRYQPLFLPERIAQLSADDFHSFLIFKNNHHWTNLQRVQKFVLADMPLLRKTLALLLDESIPIEKRLNRIRPGRRQADQSMVSHLGVPVLTAVLLVAYPDKYGVWNTTSERGMSLCKVWHKDWDKQSTGQAYTAMNAIYHDISRQLGVDLWTLDTLWWIATERGKN